MAYAGPACSTQLLQSSSVALASSDRVPANAYDHYQGPRGKSTGGHSHIDKIDERASIGTLRIKQYGSNNMLYAHHTNHKDCKTFAGATCAADVPV